MSQFASADQQFWDDYAYNQWNPKFEGMGEPVDVIRLLAHAATANITSIINGFFNGWFGGGSVGDPLEVQYTVEAIKDAVIAGATVVTVTSSGTRDIPSAITECLAIVAGGGENGENGRNSYTTDSIRPKGGRGGGYAAAPLDVDTVKGQTLSVVIGTSGGETSISLGSTKLVAIKPGDVGGIAAGVQGYAPTTSMAGDGGRGGYGATSEHGGTAGEPGEPSAVAQGGTGGAFDRSGAGGNGTAGANADPAANIKSCGGGGGGGAGGGHLSLLGDAGAGGPGGYPSGGGGGGGCGAHGGLAGSGDNGAGGIGAPGIAWLVYK